MNRILTVGDSWAAGHVEAGEGPSFLDILNVPQELRCAVDGSRIDDWREDRDGRMTKAKAQQADVLLFCLGGNDEADTQASGGPVNWIEHVFSFGSRLAAVFIEVRKKRNIVMLYAHPDPEKARKLNVLIKAAMDFFGGVEYLDLQQLFVDGDLTTSQIPHPTQRGYAKIAAEIQRMLTMNLKQCQTPFCRYTGYETFFANGKCPLCGGHDIRDAGSFDEHLGERESEKKDGHFRSDVQRERREQ